MEEHPSSSRLASWGCMSWNNMEFAGELPTMETPDLRRVFHCETHGVPGLMRAILKSP
jgi:hypothetical protein